MMTMRVETIGRYHYLTEWWYNATRHRNLPNRVRISDELAAWIETYHVPLDDLGSSMDRDSYPMPRSIKTELRRLEENPNFHGAKPVGRNPAWERWREVGHDLLDDKHLDRLKRELAHDPHLGKVHLEEILKYARNQPRTPAWREFLASLP